MSPEQNFDDTTRSWVPDRPHNDLPLLPPKVELETRPVLKGCVEARAALGELKQASELIPNVDMLINTLPVLEARASSEIEHVVTTADALFRHLNAEKDADPATKEALRYRDALLGAFGALGRKALSARTTEEICSRIKGVDMSVRRDRGTHIANRSSGKVIYTPPQGEDLLRGLLANWETFLHNATDLDPVVRMAAGHYQFEAIHPFADGNGRTGRVVNILFLVEQGLLPSPILYLSRFIIERKVTYYDLLRRVTAHGAWEPWLLFMLEGVAETARWTTAKIAAIRALADHTAQVARERIPKIYSRELIDTIFIQPYCRIGNLVDAGIVQRQAASRYLKALAEIGILREEPHGREKLFVHPKLLRLLTEDANSFEPYGG